MIHLLIFLALITLEILYFKVADHFNIIDKPNQRSSHKITTLRGGGIVFYFAVVCYFIISGWQYPWFFIGLTMITIVSFLDDVFTLSNRIRLLIHFGAVLLMAYQLQVFQMQWYYLLLTFIVVVGVINAYNFMDGINGITACYSLSVVGLLMMANRYEKFIAQDLLVYVSLGLVIFAFFNFRSRARCFAGDVGSVSIAYIILFGLGFLIIKSGNVIYALFLVVYGLDTFWTICRRLYRRENIFEAHRSHLYQFLGNEAGVNKLLVSFLYGFLQFLIGLGVLLVVHLEVFYQVLFASILFLSLSVCYLIIKNNIIYKYVDGNITISDNK